MVKNPHLIPHPTQPDIYGVFKQADWDGILWYLSYYVPPGKGAVKRSPSTKKLIVAVLLERLFCPNTRGLPGYEPGLLNMRKVWNISQLVLMKLHNHLIALLKDLKYWRD